MYVRLAFWTVSMAYTSLLFAHGQAGSSPNIMFTAALFGAVLGFALGGMFANRVKRKQS
jgi:Na+/glutamate symporter